MESVVKKTNKVEFPEFTNERIYMAPFKKNDIPDELSRWKPTIDSMLDGVETDETLYLMVDQGVIESGESHRRPGPHIDGNWIDSTRAHGTPGHVTPNAHRTMPSRHDTSADLYDETVILASDYASCKAYEGLYEGEWGEGGDCTKMDLSETNEIQLESGYAYQGNVYMVHESMPVMQDVSRTLVRINVPHHKMAA
jgi:hypothetical protein